MSNIQNKLLHYEADPPLGVWNEIAAALDSGVASPLSKKLYDLEISPPDDAWKAIDAQLNTEPHPAIVIPFYKRHKRLLKYSGTTAILVLLAIMTSLLISKKTVSETPSPTLGEITQSKNDRDSLQTADGAKGGLTPGSIAANSNIEVTRDNISRKGFFYKLKPQRIMSSALMPSSFLPEFAANARSSIGNVADDKYMVYSDGEGKAFRLPKKMFDLLACPAADELCKDRIKKLQQKIAGSAFASDFTGILDMLSNLRENQ